jgi:methylated-DNA-[protein]-cysteine S-methyltransferase
MIIESPVGALHAAFDDEGRLVELGFRPSARSPRVDESSSLHGAPAPAGHVSAGLLDDSTTRRLADSLKDLKAQLAEYFAGRRKTFDIELAPRGTGFQLAVWDALLRIPYGHTISYAELAVSIGKSNAVRAVGSANGANPIPVIIPCHRVIGSNGTLTGYGGGIERKQWLLALEGRRLF